MGSNTSRNSGHSGNLPGFPYHLKANDKLFYKIRRRLRDFRLPTRYRRKLHSSVLLHGQQWQFLIDISRQPIVPTFKRLESKKRFKNPILDPLKMEPTGFPEKSVRNYRYSMRHYPEERSSPRRQLIFKLV
jgi:hypothetical protein